MVASPSDRAFFSFFLGGKHSLNYFVPPFFAVFQGSAFYLPFPPSAAGVPRNVLAGLFPCSMTKYFRHPPPYPRNRLFYGVYLYVLLFPYFSAAPPRAVFLVYSEEDAHSRVLVSWSGFSVSLDDDLA